MFEKQRGEERLLWFMTNQLDSTGRPGRSPTLPQVARKSTLTYHKPGAWFCSFVFILLSSPHVRNNWYPGDTQEKKDPCMFSSENWQTSAILINLLSVWLFRQWLRIQAWGWVGGNIGQMTLQNLWFDFQLPIHHGQWKRPFPFLWSLRPSLLSVNHESHMHSLGKIWRTNLNNM